MLTTAPWTFVASSVKPTAPFAISAEPTASALICALEAVPERSPPIGGSLPVAATVTSTWSLPELSVTVSVIPEPWIRFRLRRVPISVPPFLTGSLLAVLMRPSMTSMAALKPSPDGASTFVSYFGIDRLTVGVPVASVAMHPLSEVVDDEVERRVHPGCRRSHVDVEDGRGRDVDAANNGLHSRSDVCHGMRDADVQLDRVVAGARVRDREAAPSEHVPRAVDDAGDGGEGRELLLQVSQRSGGKFEGFPYWHGRRNRQRIRAQDVPNHLRDQRRVDAGNVRDH